MKNMKQTLRTRQLKMSAKIAKSAKILSLTLVSLLISSCATADRFIVTSLGYEPVEATENFIYALPETGLKASVEYEKQIFIPGPYADYAQRLLGIEGVKKSRSETYSIVNASITSYKETDGSRFYTLNRIEGELMTDRLEWAEEKGLVIRGDYTRQLQFGGPQKGGAEQDFLFEDVTMESNVEMKEQTIYKTLITDTSFVKVPVTSQQMERKTLEKKAAEAAKLILEIRSDRYFLSAGIVDPLPADFDLETALKELDKLEEEYLSLFIGKSFSERTSGEYYILPEGDTEPEIFELDSFSPGQGIGAEDGNPIEMVITPGTNARSLRNLLPQEPETAVYNRFYYRIPELCDVRISHNGTELAALRVSIYQSGALVNERIGEE